ncbi:MAG TPA: CBS domain-containing protein [Gemmata sp.]|nr:CBS domain-containing protein [Gemmata sp.]
MSRLPNPDRRPPAGPLPSLGIYPAELSRNIRVDSVSRLDPATPLAVNADDSVADAVVVLRQGNAGCLLVTDFGRVVGLFTERDLLTRVLAPGRPLESPVRAVMTPDPVAVSPKDSVRTAIRRMQKGGYRNLPVVDETGRPVGVLSASRVVHYLVEHFPAIVFNQPPEPNAYPASPEGA